MNRRQMIVALFALSVIPGSIAIADDVTLGNLQISGAFARASPMMAQAGAAFMTISDHGDGDRLVSARSGISDRVELHTHIQENGMMAMREIAAIDVPANGAVELKPGGFHVMFIGLRERLAEGTTVDVTLVFEKAGEITVAMPVKGPGAMHGG